MRPGNKPTNMDKGPQTPFSQKLHADKYRGPGESFREAMNRVASTLSDNGDHFKALREVLVNMRFMPGGRIQAAVGSTRQITPYNCFVSGTIEDSLVEGQGSIMNRLKESVTTMRMGGGIGFDFSTLRPRGSVIKKLHSRSCGPVKLMHIFDAASLCIVSAGHRRGAQMAVMRIDHPDILEFVRAKQNETDLTGFNVSVAVTDEFMQAVKDDTDFALRWNGDKYDTVKARVLWDAIMRSTWDWAEPGVLFIDRINDTNNLQYCERIAATNPCGEQPLPPYGACLLGSFNLVQYLKEGKSPAQWEFDYGAFIDDIPVVVRAMDNVIDRAVYPLYEQEQEALGKRRMGLGVTGLANCLETIGHPYGSQQFISGMGLILKILVHNCYKASVALAKEKGSFPKFNRRYLDSKFIQKALDQSLRDDIYNYGIRNSHLISIAPTGTISLCADNVSSGIEPVFAYEQERTVIEEDGPKKYQVDDYAYRMYGVKGVKAENVTVDQHLAVLEQAYCWVDSAVSKTCNVPANTPWEEFKKIYMRAWETGCKGCTTYQVGGKRGAIIEETKVEPIQNYVAMTADNGLIGASLINSGSSDSSCRIDSVTGRHECE